MITVGSPIVILLGGPTGSTMVSPARQAGMLLMRTVWEPSTTTPEPCGGIGSGTAQACMSAPPAAPAIMEPMAAAAPALAASSAALAAGAAGVP